MTMKLQIKPKLAYRNIDKIFFIVDAEKETLHELNEQGSFIWNMMVKKKSRDEMVKKISEEFEVNINRAREDFDDFIGKLEKKQLVTRD